MRVLGLAGSPRRGGNTDLLLAQALAGARSAGAEAETVILADLEMRPCQHCDGCVATGQCIIDDDMLPMHHRLLQADRLILAAPIFFMGLPAQAKAVIDRCQALWVAKYLLKERHPYASDGSRRRGLFISVGGQSRADLFTYAIATVRAFFATCDVEYGEELLFPGIDPAGAIKGHPTALKEAFEAGKRLMGSLQL